MRLSLSQALGPSEMGQTCRDSPSETRHWISGSCPTYFLIYQIFIYYDDDGLDGMVRSLCLDRTSQARPTLTNDSRSTVRNHARRTQHTVPYAKRAMDDAFIAIHCAYVRNISREPSKSIAARRPGPYSEYFHRRIRGEECQTWAGHQVHEGQGQRGRHARTALT